MYYTFLSIKEEKSFVKNKSDVVGRVMMMFSWMIKMLKQNKSGYNENYQG